MDIILWGIWAGEAERLLKDFPLQGITLIMDFPLQGISLYKGFPFTQYGNL